MRGQIWLNLEAAGAEKDHVKGSQHLTFNDLTVHKYNITIVLTDLPISCDFYHAMLCIRGTSHGPVSVSVRLCLSVTSRSSTKTAKQTITQTTPHDSPGILVF